MKLFYLDSSHFAWIERASDVDPTLADEFFDAVRAGGWDLALTDVHLVERAQSGTDADSERRIAVIGRFPTLRTFAGAEVELFVHECSAHARNVANDRRPVPPVTVDRIRHALFGRPASVRDVAQRLHALAPDARWHYGRRAIESRAQNHDRARMAGVKGNRRFLQVGRAPADPAADALADELEAYFQAAPLHIRHRVAPPDESLADIPVPAWADQVKATGVPHVMTRRHVVQMYPFTPSIAVRSAPASDLLPLREMIGESVSWLPTPYFGGLPPRAIRRAFETYDPYAWPASATALALQRAMATHPKSEEPGDALDVAHAAFGPYVDRIYVDTRTRAFLTTEVANAERRPWNRSLRVENLRAPSNLRDLLDDLYT